MFQRFRRSILILLVGILLAGCSSSDQDNLASQKPDIDRVSLQLQWVTQAQFAGYYIALEKGWYRDEGIDLTIRPGGPDIVPVDVVASKAADFGTTLLSDLASAISLKKPVISIGQIQQKNGLLLLARKSSGISHPKDFYGKNVGVWLGSWEAQFNALLAREKIDTAKIKVMSQGWSMKPFINGKLDVASAMIYNEYHMVLASGISADDINVIDYADYDLAFPGDVLFTSSHMVQSRPDLCSRMVRASLRGWEYAMDRPVEAVHILLKYDTSGVQTHDHQLAMLREITKLIRVPGQRTGHVDAARLARMNKILLEYGILKSSLQPSQIFTSAFLAR